LNSSQIYIILTIVVLVLVVVLVFFVSKKKSGNEKNLSRLAGLAFAFILAGLFFSENNFVGYGLMGIGVVLAVIDMLYKLKKQKGDKPE
jgi:hypothetical protein